MLIVNLRENIRITVNGKNLFHCVTTKDGDEEMVTLYYNPDRCLAHEEEVFYIILTLHEQFGHRKSRGMHDALKSYSIFFLKNA